MQIKAETKHQEQPFLSAKICTPIRYIEKRKARSDATTIKPIKKFGIEPGIKIKRK